MKLLKTIFLSMTVYPPILMRQLLKQRQSNRKEPYSRDFLMESLSEAKIEEFRSALSVPSGPCMCGRCMCGEGADVS